MASFATQTRAARFDSLEMLMRRRSFAGIPAILLTAFLLNGPLFEKTTQVHDLGRMSGKASGASVGSKSYSWFDIQGLRAMTR